MKIESMRSQLLDRAAALLAPPRCAGCGEACDSSRWICACCRGSLRPPGRAPGRGDVSGAFAYEGPARRIVASLKFGGQVRIAEEMAELMFRALPEAMAGAEWIVPAPAHPERRRRRGYNQSALLAAALAGITGATAVDCLTRAAGRRPQSELGRHERLALPTGSIGLDARALRQAGAESLVLSPTKVVVCDDVTTTGITLEACTQAIRERQPGAGRQPLRAVVFAVA